MTFERIEIGPHVLYRGDSLEVLPTLAEASVDAVVTDPPYGLHFMGKTWDKFGGPIGMDYHKTRERCGSMHAGEYDPRRDDEYQHAMAAAFAECLRVLKPGGHLLCFGSPRRFHRLMCALEDAGFELRDTLCWLFGQGFPKSLNVSKAIDRGAGAEREVVGIERRSDKRGGNFHGASEQRPMIDWERTIPATPEGVKWNGWGTALKPGHEIIIKARKPLPSEELYATIGSHLTRLEGCLWSLLPASIAVESFALSPSEYDAACASAQWPAGGRQSTQAALSGAMGTSLFALATISSLSTVRSWKSILADAWNDGNTSTTETESSTTIDLKILKCCLSEITPAAIIEAHKPGYLLSAIASIAVVAFNAEVTKWRVTREHFATVPAIARHLAAFPDGGVGLEYIAVARKPLDGTVAANVAKHGTGALNIDGCRIGVEGGTAGAGAGAGARVLGDGLNGKRGLPVDGLGRWPANVVHDGSDEVLAGFPDSAGQAGDVTGREPTSIEPRNGNAYGTFNLRGAAPARGDSGSAARFFYTAKASREDREAGLRETETQVTHWSGEGMPLRQDGTERKMPFARNTHPTVKPTDLMRWLVRLVTPPGGLVLDPFMGSGSTGKACSIEGFRFLGIEREAEYVELSRARIAHACEVAAKGPEAVAAEAAGQLSLLDAP